MQRLVQLVQGMRLLVLALLVACAAAQFEPVTSIFSAIFGSTLLTVVLALLIISVNVCIMYCCCDYWVNLL